MHELMHCVLNTISRLLHYTHIHIKLTTDVSG